jgi:Tol biopolymer transport system component
MRRLPTTAVALALALPLAACPMPGQWGSTSYGGATAPAAEATPTADTPPPSPDLAITGAARNLVQLTTTPEGETRPIASPDGKTLLFTAWSNKITDGQDTGEIAEQTIGAMRPDGRVIATYSSRRALARDATWLNDHSFAYISNAMGDFQIVRAARLAPNAATTVVVRSDAAPEAGGLNSSRNGKVIAFHTKLNGQFMIATVHPDGSELTTLAPGSYPRISPDGGRIVFHRHVGETWRIFVIAADGGDETQLTDGDMDCLEPAWSPDGAWIVMDCNGSNLYVMHPDGTELTQLTDGARSTVAPEWSVDGSIYFDANQAGNHDLWKLTPVLGK